MRACRFLLTIDFASRLRMRLRSSVASNDQESSDEITCTRTSCPVRKARHSRRQSDRVIYRQRLVCGKETPGTLECPSQLPFTCFSLGWRGAYRARERSVGWVSCRLLPAPACTSFVSRPRHRGKDTGTLKAKISGFSSTHSCGRRARN
jgi:hypothetical protein